MNFKYLYPYRDAVHFFAIWGDLKMFKLSNKEIGILITISLICFLVMFFHFSHETLAINSIQSSGQINFKANISHGTMNLGQAFTNPKNNITTLNSTGTVETGTGTNTFTMTYKNDNDMIFDMSGAKFTLTIIDANGATCATTQKVDRTKEGILSVTLNSPQSGKGHYLLTSTIIETRARMLSRLISSVQRMLI